MSETARTYGARRHSGNPRRRLRALLWLLLCAVAIAGCREVTVGDQVYVRHDADRVSKSIRPIRNQTAGRDDDTVTLTNLTDAPIVAPILLFVQNISVESVTGIDFDDPFLGGSYKIETDLAPGESVDRIVSFSNPDRARYTYEVLVYALAQTTGPDLDGDGIPDDQDPDIDGDGFSNDDEAAVGTDPFDAGSVPPDLDGDFIPDDLDDDRDGDGVGNAADLFPDDPSESSDLDGDGLGDNSDPDRDGDGVDNGPDAFPDDPNESSDLDGDGQGDNADPDRDGDGVDNDVDSFPDDPTEWNDLDGDGQGDNADPDRDGDNVDDALDLFPDDPAEWADLDGDGQGDNSDPDRDGDGFTNDDETAAGTDPNDPNDFPSTGTIDLTLDGSPTRTVQDAEVTLAGSVNTAFTGSLVATSDRMPGIEIAAIVAPPGSWSVELPLAPGENRLTVTATSSESSESVEALVTRLVAPTITIDEPRVNAVVDEEVIRVVGRVTDPITLNPPRVELQGQSVTATPAGVGLFDFVIENVLLAEGLNELLVEAFSDQLSSELTLAVTLDTDEAPAPPPLISITSPVVNSYLDASSFELVGTVQSFTGLPELQIDGAPVALTGSGQTQFFRELQTFGGADQLELSLVAEDAVGRTTTQDLVYHFDDAAPVLTVDGGYLPSPEVNDVATNPFTLSGSVEDANLASVTVADEAVGVVQRSPGIFDFSLQLALATETATPVEIRAADLAGNVTSQRYEFQTDATDFVEPLLPFEDSEFIATEPTLSVGVAARVSEILAGMQVVARFTPDDTSSPPVLLDVANGIASGDVVLPGVAGAFAIFFEIRDAGDQVVASASRSVRIETVEVGELEVTRVEPANEEEGVEPNQFIGVYFNQAIDPALLAIQVYETVHGLSYVKKDAPGTEALFARGAVLEEINRDRELVPGSVSVLPGDEIVAFYPTRDLAYGAQIYAEVIYDGEPLKRWTYSNRALPSFVIGGVADQLQQFASGLEVMIEELGRRTRTNEDGGFAFGFGDDAEDRIPSGRYQLVLNPDMANPEYGTVTHWITVQEGRKNDVGLKRVPLLNQEVGFRLVESGDPNVVLAGGDVRLDLSQATLIFPDSRTSGAVHVQFNSTSQVVYPATPLALPHWMYGFQPAGITVSGPVGVDLALPTLFGSADYVSAEAPYVLLMGVDDDSNFVVPIGVGLVENGRVRAVGSLAIERLDYLGIAIVVPELQELLTAFAVGEIGLEQLLAGLAAEQ